MEYEVVTSDVTAAHEVGEHGEELVEELRVVGAADDGAGGAGREADTPAEVAELSPQSVVGFGLGCILWPRLVVDGVVRAHSGHPAEVVSKHVRQKRADETVTTKKSLLGDRVQSRLSTLIIINI